jgi:hypothetical protein
LLLSFLYFFLIIFSFIGYYYQNIISYYLFNVFIHFFIIINSFIRYYYYLFIHLFETHHLTELFLHLKSSGPRETRPAGPHGGDATPVEDAGSCVRKVQLVAAAQRSRTVVETEMNTNAQAQPTFLFFFPPHFSQRISCGSDQPQPRLAIKVIGLGR